jgi:tetratricopeptide (TPR) repeat protein
VNFHSARDDAAATGETLEEAIARFPDDPTLRMLHTETLLAQDRQPAAREELRAFRENTFEGDPQIDYLRARLELADGNPARAAARLTKLAPLLDQAATQFWLGRALELSGDSQGARRRYALAQQRDRHWSPPIKASIALERRAGAWRAMLGHARNLVKNDPLDLDGWIAAVVALENLGEGVTAEQLARQCLQRFPDQPQPQLLLARAQRAQGRYDDALEALTAAEALGRGTQVTAERILTLGMARRLNEGFATAKRALASDPEDAALHAAHAALLFASGDANRGAEATDRALALEPDEPRPLRVRCEFRASVGDWSGARNDCERYLAARPDDAGAAFLMGIALQSLGERRAASEAYRRAASLDERDARSRNNLAELLADAGDLEGALAAAQEAYRLDETNPYIMDTLGALYLKKGLAERAISLLQEARAAAPELDEVTLHLALAYRDTGRASEARALLVPLQQAETDDRELRAEIEEALHSLP